MTKTRMPHPIPMALLCTLLCLGGCKKTPRAIDTDGGGSGTGQASGQGTANDDSHWESSKAFAAGRAQATVTQGSFGALASPRLREVARHFPRRPPTEVEPPMSLTASDGTGLELVALGARAAIEGPLALTELHLTFHNPMPRVVEGRFAITLPEGAAISRFAMKLASGWQEAEVVERQRARQVYEDFLHRRQDPALLEKKAGNQFRARIFPIPASGIKEIKISYSQELTASDEVYRLPLEGLPQMRSLEITALLGKAQPSKVSSSLGGKASSQQVLTLAKQNYKPDRDFTVPSMSQVKGLRHDNLVLARVRPQLPKTLAAAKIGSLLMLVDTSASRAAGFAGEVERLGQLVAQLRQRHGDGFKLQVTCFDQIVSPIFDGKAGDFGEAQLRSILERRALGASNLFSALTWAAGQRGFNRLLLVTDGVATAGLIEGEALHRAAKKLASNYHRIDTVLVGGIRDRESIQRIVRGTVEQDGLALDGELAPEALAERLSLGTVSGIEVNVPGARWVWPSRLDGVQPGDEVLVYADVPPSALDVAQPLTVELKGAAAGSQRVPLYAAKRPLLERAWIQARIARLADRRDRMRDADRDMKDAIKKQIIELSTKHRVLSDYTALLVLETEHDYARYGIDRRALANILTVGSDGVTLQAREQPVVVTKPPIGLANRFKEGPPTTRGGPAEALGGAPAPQAGDGGEDDRQTSTVMRDEAPGQGNEGRAASAEAPAPPASVAPAPEMDRTAREEEAPRRKVRAAARRRPARSTGDPLGGLRLDERDRRPRPSPRPVQAERKQEQVAPYSGRMAKVMELLAAGRKEQGLLEALTWRSESPADVMALVALGEALEANGQTMLAARAYGSIIDLFPSRADMRRFAGERLERLGKTGQSLAADSFAEAVAQRPDHPGSHRLLAFALLRLAQPAAAFEALEAGLSRQYPQGRFRGVVRILREDLGLVAAAWLKQDPARAQEIEKRLQARNARLATEPSLRFVLQWETDANDVDFHIHDGAGGHAYYSTKQLPSGGELFADVTTGYGPECFSIPGKPRAFPYKLQAHYFSRGPMGYGMGKLEIIQHDGNGGFKFEQRPFVVMNDHAYVDLGVVKDFL